MAAKCSALRHAPLAISGFPRYKTRLPRTGRESTPHHPQIRCPYREYYRDRNSVDSVPCGVTLGMAVTAAANGSAVGGAPIMAGFALGGAPAAHCRAYRSAG